MKISREFAQILIDLLNNNSNYDKQIAIKQLESAIRDEILYGKIKPESRRITPSLVDHNFDNDFDDDDDDVRIIRQRIARIIEPHENGRDNNENNRGIIANRTIGVGTKNRRVV